MVVSDRSGWMLALIVAACGGDDASDTTGAADGTGAPTSAGDDGGPVGDGGTGPASGDGSSAGDDGPSTGDDTGPDPLPPASVESLELVCKVINDESVQDPTANATHTRFNLRATDLGIPVVIGDLLHVFFGDTHGYREIWDIGEDPDSVAWVDAAAAAADPSVLCTDLSFLVTPDVPSVAADTDPSIERDFAAGWMLPPAGEDVASYITHHPGPFPNIPGSFEVPGGALAVGGDAYLFWAGKSELDPYARMTLSYLARWDAPRDLPVYQIVRPIDSLYDGPLGGHFIQILPFVEGDTLYLFGTGEFRRSGIHLARMPLDAIETGAGQELWDPDAGQWLDPTTLDPAAKAAIEPTLETTGIGELGGVFIEGPDVYLIMFQQATWDGDTLLSNRVIARTSPAPTGPWSEPLVVIDMGDAQFVGQYCCAAEPCVGEAIWACASAGLYGAYPLPSPKVTPRDDGAWTVDLPFFVSTWMPYNVVLFSAQLVVPPQP